jgi:hypothetical protein
MSIFDPPSDPYGNEVRCPFCDYEMEQYSLTKEYYCDNPDCPQKEQE